MKSMLLFLGAVASAIASEQQFGADAGGWKTWSPRTEIAPKAEVDSRRGHGDRNSLRLETRAAAEYGAWQREFDGLTGGKPHRFEAWYRAENVANERRSVIARVEWLDAKGKPVRPPEYALDAGREKSGWTRVLLETPSPTNAVTARVQLSLGFAPRATVWWDDISLQPVEAMRNRTIRAVTVYCRPSGQKSAEANVEQFCRLLEKSSGSLKADIICLPEGITVVGTGRSYAEVSETIPGPSTKRLGDLARLLNSYVVAGIYERSNHVIYNTAVLLGRDGKLVGTYRKTHLPREEWEAGITAGDDYPVFQTDFGRVGMMVCWDLQFPEPCRAMAAQGAELILLPIWGGNEILARARAIENHVFLVTSSYDMKTFIVDPTGQTLAEADKESPVASAELRLDQKIFQPWLGDMKNRTWKERRPDIAVH